MDPKATAKSKRSHSQQSKRNHPTPSTASAGQKKKPPPPLPLPPQQKQTQQQPGAEQRSRRPHHHLPSNWDRYREDDDGIVGEGEVGLEPGMGPAKRASAVGDGGDAVEPKSEGADFGYLVEQARSQPHDHGGAGSLGSASSFDDTLPDFLQGLSPILSVRGKSLVSRCGNENFIVDDDAASNFEVPFLSMDLDALAAQLAKLSMAQRLFVESDSLPAELDIDGLGENKAQAIEHVETANTSESQRSLVQVAYQEFADMAQPVEGHNIMPKAGKEVPPSSTCRQGTKPSPMDYLGSLNQHSGRGVQESIPQFNMRTDLDLNKASRFEAATAEAELDVLLDSFPETNPFNSSTMGRNLSNSYATKHGFHGHSAEMGAVSLRHESSSSRDVSTTVSLEDTIDDLLAETGVFGSPAIDTAFSNSSVAQPKSHDFSAHMGVLASRQDPSSSRKVATTVSLEDTIDDLLAETEFPGSYERARF